MVDKAVGLEPYADALPDLVVDETGKLISGGSRVAAEPPPVDEDGEEEPELPPPTRA